MKEVIMPKFGFTQEDSEIVEWAVKDGDKVEQGDVLAVVTTDKVTMEVEAPESGIVAGIQYKVGDVVLVTKVIAYILKPGETLPAELQAGASKAAAAPAPAVPAALPQAAAPVAANAVKLTPVASRVAAEKGLDTSSIVGSGPNGKITRADVEQFAQTVSNNGNGRIPATPAAKRLAREQSVELKQVPATGPNHRVQAADVLSFVEKNAATVAVPAVQGLAPVQSGTIRTIPFSGMRKTIALNMARSAQTIPAIQLEIDVDMEAMLALHQKAKTRAGEKKVSLTALIVNIVAWALVRNPMLNSQLGETEISLLPDVNIGMAVAIEGGLIVPVIHNADKKGILELAGEINDVSARARQNKLKGNDLDGATFTISNLGMFGIDRFTAIINPPQVGILAISGLKKQFVPDASGAPVLHSLMNMRLSADHRVVDGVVAAQFLADLRRGFESPEEMLL